MKFSEFILNNHELDMENSTYTRYMLNYNHKLDIPILVAFTSNRQGNVGIKIHKTNLPKLMGKGLEDGNYEDELSKAISSGGDFDVDEDPLTTLDSAAMGDYAIVNSVYTKKNYCRKGLGSYAMQLVQDYYRKTNAVGYGNRHKNLYAARRSNDDDVYSSRAYRGLGTFGKLLSHTKAKVRSNKEQLAYASFLAKNNFMVEDHPYQVPRKVIMSDRNMISERLLDEYNRPLMIQCFDTIVGLEERLQVR